MVIKSFKNDKITDVRKEVRINPEMIPLSNGSFVATGIHLGESLKDFPYLYFMMQPETR